jgi:hypothetical protein
MIARRHAYECFMSIPCLLLLDSRSLDPAATQPREIPDTSSNMDDVTGAHPASQINSNAGSKSVALCRY